MGYQVFALTGTGERHFAEMHNGEPTGNFVPEYARDEAATFNDLSSAERFRSKLIAMYKGTPNHYFIG